jgi:hypothetical protein
MLSIALLGRLESHAAHLPFQKLPSFTGSTRMNGAELQEFVRWTAEKNPSSPVKGDYD